MNMINERNAAKGSRPFRHPRELYIDLLKSAILNDLYRKYIPPPDEEDIQSAKRTLAALKRRYGDMIQRGGIDEQFVVFQQRRSSVVQAHTLGDRSQVENVEKCLRSIIEDNIQGDLIEAGVFRGGMVLLMAGILEAYGCDDRIVYVADSFEGWPKPIGNEVIEDSVCFDLFEPAGSFSAPVDEVVDNFEKYGLMSDSVRILKGWFDETLPRARIDKLSLIRVDADWYESTWTVLDVLYDKVESGGYVIIDDYGLPIGARRAVDQFRKLRQIESPLVWVNDQTVFWRKV
jgi:O-methyltransferase